MSSLKSLLAENPSESGIWAAYVSLASKLGLADIAARLSRSMGLQMTRSDAFDECDAYVGSIYDHDVTVLITRDEADKGRFQIMIEPSFTCTSEGPSLHLTSNLLTWLKRCASDVGRFSEIG